MKTAGQQSTKMSFYYHTAAATAALVSGTVDFVSFGLKFSKYSIVECRYKHHRFAETAVCRQSLRVC